MSWLYFFDKTQFFVTGLTACFQVYTRSAGVTYFIVGALSCSLSVKLIKRLVRQPRPTGSSQKLTYGMPSTHSAGITYYACYISAASLYLPPHKSLEYVSSAYFRALTPLVIIPWAAIVLCSRVWLGHHTWKQVAVGCGYGASFACLWLALWVRGLDVLANEAEDRLVEFLDLA
ncbi:PAP2-domain-containing protein [Gautieria morchelliformis]|nr:PAP2-domain-containing protein [Gautieria morchelliformis]